jgi:hypothetical protein
MHARLGVAHLAPSHLKLHLRSIRGISSFSSIQSISIRQRSIRSIQTMSASPASPNFKKADSKFYLDGGLSAENVAHLGELSLCLSLSIALAVSLSLYVFVACVCVCVYVCLCVCGCVWLCVCASPRSMLYAVHTSYVSNSLFLPSSLYTIPPLSTSYNHYTYTPTLYIAGICSNVLYLCPDSEGDTGTEGGFAVLQGAFPSAVQVRGGRVCVCIYLPLCLYFICV